MIKVFSVKELLTTRRKQALSKMVYKISIIFVPTEIIRSVQQIIEISFQWP